MVGHDVVSLPTDHPSCGFYDENCDRGNLRKFVNTVYVVQHGRGVGVA